jgi:hypothetical protein
LFKQFKPFKTFKLSDLEAAKLKVGATPAAIKPVRFQIIDMRLYAISPNSPRDAAEEQEGD